MREPAETAQPAVQHSASPGLVAWLDPRRAFWLGVVFLALGTWGGVALMLGTTAIGGQELTVSWPMWTLSFLLNTGIPLGAGFVVASIVARAIDQKVRHQRAADTGSAVDDVRLPPSLRPRTAVLLGLGLILVAVIDQNLHFAQFIPTRPGIERDILTALVPLLSILAPLGSALIPGGWLLARIERIAPFPKR